MKALYYVEPGRTEIREVPDPKLENPTDAVVDILATSICGSDLHIVAGTMLKESGFVLGHEMVGVVREVGSAVREFQPGEDRLSRSNPASAHADGVELSFRQRHLGPAAGNHA